MMVMQMVMNIHRSILPEALIRDPISMDIKIIARWLATRDPVENGKRYDEAHQKANEPKQSAWMKYWFSHLNLLPLHSTTTIG